MINSNDTVGNRTRDLPTCSAVPQPTALPRAQFFLGYIDVISPKEHSSEVCQISPTTPCI